MPKCLQPRNTEEFAASYMLPIVIELNEGGRKTLYFIEDHECFMKEQSEAREPGDIFLDYEKMKALAKKHGERMRREDFERGGVFPSISGGTPGKCTYAEYRFRASEADK